jgi:archaeoflavoprotein AfpA
MTAEHVKVKKRKVAWGITGGGDKIAETLEIMKEIQKEFADAVEVQVFLSKAGDLVLKYYGLEGDLRQSFGKVRVELNSNAPFLAAWMQMRKYEFLLIAPATSNTVAKIASSIGDTMLTNATIMSLKAFVPVYVAPTDYKVGTVYTTLPNGKKMELRIREEEVEKVRRLERMDGMTVLEGPQKIRGVFKEWFG